MRLIARLTALAAALLLAVSCLDDPTGLAKRAGGLTLQPRFAGAAAAAIVDIRTVRVVLRGPGEARARMDTVVSFAGVGDTLKLNVLVPLQAATELLELTLAMMNAAGDTVYRAGPMMVTASTDPSRRVPAEPLFTYVGVGANASGVRFVQPPVSIGFGQSVTLVAEAFDAQEIAINGTPVGFELVNPADSVFAKFMPAGSATLVAGLDSSSVTVRALLPGGQTATHTIEIIAPAPNLWVSALGGDWSDGANWSRGTAPLAGDSVLVTLDGTYSVNVDVPVTLARLVMGGTSGVQTLEVPATGSLTVGDSALFGSTASVEIAGGELGGSGYMRIPQLELSSGTLAHGGTVEITGNMQWLGGGISSNGVAGRTRIMPGAALVIDGTAVKTFVGPHVLEVAYDPQTQTGGQIVFDGTGDLYAGSGARIENHARVWMQGSGDMLSNLDPPMAVFENTVSGSLEATTGAVTGSRTMGFALDNLGSLFVNIPDTDTLRFTGGSVNNFGGFVGAEVGTLALDARTYTLTDPLSVAAPLAITGSALLDLGEDTATVSGDLTLRSGGRIRSVSDLALLRVDGSATFDGGASELTAGTLEIGGNFVQSRVNTSFQATGTHVTRFVGFGAQSISFSSPTPTTSQFRTLEIANMSATDSVVLMSDAYVTDSLHVLTGRLGGVSPHRLVVGGNINLQNPNGAAFVRPFVMEVGGLFTNDVGGIAPDTLVLNRAGPYVWDGLTVPSGSHLRFSTGVVTLQATSTPGDLTASGNARIVIPTTGNRAVLGNLATQGGGTLQMNAGSDLSVNGDATFAGGGTVSLLSGGRLSVAGDFVQSSANNNASFAPSSNHVTVLTGATSSSVSFDSPNVSGFDSLFVAKAQFPRSTITLLTDVRVTGGMFARDGSDIVGPTARLQIVGGTLNTTISTASPTVNNLLALELSAPPDSIRSLVSPDTVVLNAGITALPNFLPLQYRSIRLNTAGAVTFGNDTIAGDLDIATGAAAFVGTTNFRVNGKLRTRGSGVLMMLSTDANLWVVDSAIFGGGSTNGALTQGALRLSGTFAQGGGDPAAFSATGTHRTWIEGTAAQSVAFANPGIGTGLSHFADVQIGNESAQGIELVTPVFAEERLLSTGGRFAISRVWSASAAQLSVEGMAADSITFDGVPLNIGPSAPFTTMSVISFQSMDPAVNHLTITRPGGAYTFLNQLSFGTVPSTGSYNFVVNNSGATMTVLVSNPVQPFNQMVGPPHRYLLTGAQAQPVVTWGGQTLPASP